MRMCILEVKKSKDTVKLCVLAACVQAGASCLSSSFPIWKVRKDKCRARNCSPQSALDARVRFGDDLYFVPKHPTLKDSAKVSKMLRVPGCNSPSPSPIVLGRFAGRKQ